MPFRDFEHNRVWLEIARLAHDLIAWTQRLLLSGELAKAEPKRLRYRLLHVAGRLALSWLYARESEPPDDETSPRVGARHRSGAGQPYVTIRRCPSPIRLQHEQDEPLRERAKCERPQRLDRGGSGRRCPGDDPSLSPRRLLRARPGGEPWPHAEAHRIALPEGYAPCQICAPGSRSSTAASGRPARGKAQRSTGVQPGHLVDVEDVDTGRVSTYRIAFPDRPLDSGEISPRSPPGTPWSGKPRERLLSSLHIT